MVAYAEAIVLFAEGGKHVSLLLGRGGEKLSWVCFSSSSFPPFLWRVIEGKAVFFAGGLDHLPTEVGMVGVGVFLGPVSDDVFFINVGSGAYDTLIEVWTIPRISGLGMAGAAHFPRQNVGDKGRSEGCRITYTYEVAVNPPGN